MSAHFYAQYKITKSISFTQRYGTYLQIKPGFFYFRILNDTPFHPIRFCQRFTVLIDCFLKDFYNFAIADRYAEARSGFEWRDADIMKSVYLRSFLTC